MKALFPVVLLALGPIVLADEEIGKPAIEPLMRTIDLKLGQEETIRLSDRRQATVKLVDLKESRDTLRGAVRRAEVTVEVNGQTATLESAMYNLPTEVGGVQIDCPVTKGFVENSSGDNPWALDADARLRLWPAGSPWIRPESFGYPLNARRFSSDTQMGNDPCYVNACDLPGLKKVYYHYGLDFGGAEGLVEVVAATDGVVVSARGELFKPDEYPPNVKPRYDVVYLRDDRGWYYRYSHLFEIDGSITLGEKVRMGDRIGLLGKEGGSGGWSHLHFDIQGPQPSGRYGIIDAYAFAWQAYQRQHPEPLVAVARPHIVAWVGEEVTLDGSRSWSARGPQSIKQYVWLLDGGERPTGAKLARIYDKPGQYCELLKVSDDEGNTAFDLAVVQVFDPKATEAKSTVPAIHAAYFPTWNIKVGDTVTFKARTFNIDPKDGYEVWDFGDGSPPVMTQSDGNARTLAKDGYAITSHRYYHRGQYLVTVHRTNIHGQKATTKLVLTIESR